MAFDPQAERFRKPWEFGALRFHIGEMGFHWVQLGLELLDLMGLKWLIWGVIGFQFGLFHGM